MRDELVGVVGAGTMGSGIAITFARAGYPTVLCDVTQEAAQEGARRVEQFLDTSVAKGRLDEAVRDAAVDSLIATSDLEAMAGCSVVCEAIFEDLALKADLFGRLDDICGPDTLFHTNTSTLSVTSMSTGSSWPGRVVGTHYCNPAPLMALVEVVKGAHTGVEAHARTVDFLESLAKTPITVADRPGFILNRFLIPFENNAIRLLEAGLASAESIDAVVKEELGYPMGPFTLLDIVGMDVHKAVATSLYEQLRDPRFAPPPLVHRMISEGRLGRKAGQGFYEYADSQHFGSSTDDGQPGKSDELDRPGFLRDESGQSGRTKHLRDRLLLPYLNDVIGEYHSGLAPAADMDRAIELGLGYPTGPLALLDHIGLEAHRAATAALYEELHDPTFAPPPPLIRMIDAGESFYGADEEAS